MNIPVWVTEASKSLGELLEYADVNLSDKPFAGQKILRVGLSIAAIFLGLITFENRINGLICVVSISLLVITVLLYKKSKGIRTVGRCAVYSNGVAFGPLSSEHFIWNELSHITHWHYESIDDYDQDIFTVILKRGGGMAMDSRVINKAQNLTNLISQTGNIPIRPK